eukprot:COSAG05_NODE_5663_length_1119_cov_6.735632_1_plen_42_part_10
MSWQQRRQDEPSSSNDTDPFFDTSVELDNQAGIELVDLQGVT